MGMKHLLYEASFSGERFLKSRFPAFLILFRLFISFRTDFDGSLASCVFRLKETYLVILGYAASIRYTSQ
jgi:hypothetical protein